MQNVPRFCARSCARDMIVSLSLTLYLRRGGRCLRREQNGEDVTGKDYLPCGNRCLRHTDPPPLAIKLLFRQTRFALIRISATVNISGCSDKQFQFSRLARADLIFPLFQSLSPATSLSLVKKIYHLAEFVTFMVFFYLREISR